MAQNNTEEKVNLREVSGDWLFRQYWHCPKRPSDLLYYEYTKVLMNLAAADGVLADEERQWILGNLAAKGCNEEMYNFFKNYMPSQAELEVTFKERPKFVLTLSGCVLFEAFLAASADQVLHEKERDAIYKMGKAMGVEEARVVQIEQLAAHEQSHRRLVVSLLTPQGLQQHCKIADSDFEKDHDVKTT